MDIYNQFLNLLIFFITGMIIGILFDFFRIMRKTFKTPDIITYIQDVLFWVLTGLLIIFTSFKFNNGEIRLYIFTTLLSGFIIYIFTLSKYVISINVFILSIIKNILIYPINLLVKGIKKFIVRPFKVIYQNIKEKLTKIMNKRRNLWKNVEKNIYNQKTGE